jgi:hypothetical protein
VPIIILAELIGELSGAGRHDTRLGDIILAFRNTWLSETALSADFVDPNKPFEGIAVDWLHALRQCLRFSDTMLGVTVFCRIKHVCPHGKIAAKSPFKKSGE